MDHTTTKLQAAAEDLKKCLENILHEDDLQNRAPSMTSAHHQSLRQVFAGRFGHKESAMLHWLQLSMNSPGQGNEGIKINSKDSFSAFKVRKQHFIIVQWF